MSSFRIRRSGGVLGECKPPQAQTGTVQIHHFLTLAIAGVQEDGVRYDLGVYDGQWLQWTLICYFM
jgi:hypothetical protein